MLSFIKGEKRIDRINIGTLADDVVFTLGDFLKHKKINQEAIDLGIELCEAVLRGKEVKPEKMRMENVADYERYKIIEKSSSVLKKKGIDIDSLSKNIEEVKLNLTKIKEENVIDDENVKEIQSFFIAISMPFWNENLKSFRQRKISKGLHVNE